MEATFEFLAQTVGIARGLPTKSLLIEGKRKARTPGVTAAHLASFGVEEEAFVATAIRHKVSRSALAGLSLQGITLSEKGRSALEMSARASALRAALAAREAMTITQALARHGIASAVIKGPAAALQLYGNIAEREFYDLDIVAKVQEGRKAIPVLRELGFEPDERSACKLGRVRGAADTARDAGTAAAKPNPIAQRPHHIVFSHPGRPFRVEVHDRAGWEAENFGNDDFDTVFSRIVMLDAGAVADMGASGGMGIGAGSIRFPSLYPVDHAVLLIAHGSRHAWCLLHWLLDAAAILSRKDSAFQEELAEKITTLDMSRQLKVVCSLVQRLYPIELPGPAARVIENEKKNLEGAICYARARLEKGGRDLVKFRHALTLPLLYLAPQLKSLRQKARVCIAPFKIPESDLAALPLPGALSFLHLFARPFFVAARRMRKK